MMQECPHCGSTVITCKRCRNRWSPRDMNNIPAKCPSCNNDWRIPFKYRSKYQDATVLQH